MTRFSLRTRITLLVTVVAVVTLGVLTTVFNLLLRSNLNADANRVLQARAAAALEGVSLAGERIRIKETPDSGVPDSQVWVYRGQRAVERPPAPAAVQRLANSLAGGPPKRAESTRFDLRLAAVPVVENSKRVGTVVSALSVEPYEHSASRALVDSLIYAIAALAFVLVATRLVVNRALHPVAEMTAEATDWSEHDIEHRFNVGEPHDELTALAATFDGMLERLASSLRHEQLLTAELSHELRTPLAAIVAEAELALRRDRDSDEYKDALAEIASRASQMQRTLETLLKASRGDSLRSEATTDAVQVGEQTLAGCDSIARERGVELRLDPPPIPVRVDVDADTAERILAPLVENACRHGGHRVEVAVRPSGEAVSFIVTDDGPGVAGADRERIFEAGVRSTPDGSNGHGGAGLGLPLARRLARAIGGDVIALPSDAGGCFEARVPAARLG